MPAPEDQNAAKERQFLAAMNRRAAAYCTAITTAYFRGARKSAEWENLLREAADNLTALVLYLHKRRHNLHPPDPDDG